MRRFMGVLAIAAIAASWPAWASASDQDTAQQIADSLRASGQLVDYSVGVKFKDGTAVLLGRVASEDQRETATALARQMPMVTGVVNKLEVKATRPTAGTTAGNAAGSVRFNPGASETSAPSAGARVVYPENMDASSVNLTGAQSQSSVSFLGNLGNLINGKPRQAPASNYRPAMTNNQAARPAATGFYNDPGDPLVRSQSGRFAAQPSRRFATEPSYSPAPSSDELADATSQRGQVQPVSGSDARRNAVKQASQFDASGNEGDLQPPARPAPVRTPARPASAPAYRAAPAAAGTPATPVSNQQVPAQQAGFYHARRVYGPPMPYGPAMGGCQGGACSGPAYEQPNMPNYAWPSYASYPNYAAVTYPKQYSPTAWPYIGPFYPYPQVPLGWRKVALEWDDGWWYLDFYDHHCHH